MPFAVMLTPMKLVVAITGASGSLYAQRLLQVLNEDAGRIRTRSMWP